MEPWESQSNKGWDHTLRNVTVVTEAVCLWDWNIKTQTLSAFQQAAYETTTNNQRNAKG